MCSAPGARLVYLALPALLAPTLALPQMASIAIAAASMRPSALVCTKHGCVPSGKGRQTILISCRGAVDEDEWKSCPGLACFLALWMLVVSAHDKPAL